MNRCNGEKFAGDELLYTTKSNETLGPLYFKALYVQYTGGNFETEAGHSPWLGLLGPLIQTQVQLPPHHHRRLQRTAPTSALAPQRISQSLPVNFRCGYGNYYQHFACSEFRGFEWKVIMISVSLLVQKLQRSSDKGRWF